MGMGLGRMIFSYGGEGLKILKSTRVTQKRYCHIRKTCTGFWGYNDDIRGNLFFS